MHSMHTAYQGRIVGLLALFMRITSDEILFLFIYFGIKTPSNECYSYSFVIHGWSPPAGGKGNLSAWKRSLSDGTIIQVILTYKILKVKKRSTHRTKRSSGTSLEKMNANNSFWCSVLNICSLLQREILSQLLRFISRSRSDFIQNSTR